MAEERDEEVDKQEADADGYLRCPKCGCKTLAAVTNGYSVGKGCAGFLVALVMLPFSILGLLCGFCGAQKTYTVCMKCGYRWRIR